MIYRFRADIYTEGGRVFIKLPFNVWEETGIKGNIPCRVQIRDISFECKLIPEGNGNYFIPITKKTLSALEPEEEYEIEMEPIETLSRINHNRKGDTYRSRRASDDGVSSVPAERRTSCTSHALGMAGVADSPHPAMLRRRGYSLSRMISLCRLANQAYQQPPQDCCPVRAGI